MDEAQMREDVARLATLEGRMVGTAGHRRAGDYLMGRLEDLGCEPLDGRFDHRYRWRGESMVNVMGVVPGRRRELPPLLLGAHYDTCGPLPGADDNAAAVAMSLEVGRQLAARPADRDVILALFDAEEPPHYLGLGMGSVRWYEQQRTGPVHGAVILDLVGHDVAIGGLEDLLFVMGAESDPALPAIAIEDSPGLRVQPALERYVPSRSDHHVFKVHERPYLFLSCGEWEHYHRPTDTPDRLSWSKIRAVTGYVERTLRRMAEAELAGPYGGGETTRQECERIRRHFGAVTPLAHVVRWRWQVDAFVGVMRRVFGLA